MSANAVTCNNFRSKGALKPAQCFLQVVENPDLSCAFLRPSEANQKPMCYELPTSTGSKYANADGDMYDVTYPPS